METNDIFTNLSRSDIVNQNLFIGDGCPDGINIRDVAKRFLETVGIEHL